MRQIFEYIQEARQSYINKILDKNGKELHPIFMIYDEETLDEYLNNCKTNKTYWENKKLCMCVQKNSKYMTNTNIVYHINELDIDNDFIFSNKTSYTREDLLYLFEKEKNILILI